MYKLGTADEVATDRIAYRSIVVETMKEPAVFVDGDLFVEANDLFYLFSEKRGGGKVGIHAAIVYKKKYDRKTRCQLSRSRVGC